MTTVRFRGQPCDHVHVLHYYSIVMIILRERVLDQYPLFDLAIGEGPITKYHRQLSL